jgi:hypothetical protein
MYYDFARAAHNDFNVNDKVKDNTGVTNYDV